LSPCVFLKTGLVQQFRLESGRKFGTVAASKDHMDAIQKRRWKVALFAIEIVLLATWAFFIGMNYNTSSRKFLVPTFGLGACFILQLISDRSRIL
jgi:hypothetical protein